MGQLRQKSTYANSDTSNVFSAILLNGSRDGFQLPLVNGVVAVNEDTQPDAQVNVSSLLDTFQDKLGLIAVGTTKV